MAVALTVGAAATAQAARTFRPQVGRAMGIVPVAGSGDVALGSPYPVLYHGGSVMRPPVTIHTVFWAPRGYAFGGSPGDGALGYQALTEQFFGDLAHDSGSSTNVFSVLDQYPDGMGANGYGITYDPAVDAIDDTDAYPTHQCPSPSGIATCITDQEVQAEISHVIAAHDPTGVGLHDLWEVFLPPNVDECSQQGMCGTNAFGAYHSAFAAGSTPVIYAVMIDGVIEFTPSPGSDPQGNPDAESSIDSAAHETVEAITNPVGVGWMDPNGFEVADKCESGPEIGTPLGYAPDGSPFNQVIAGHDYLFQDMWSDDANGCVQQSATTASALPLAGVTLRQFGPVISGHTGQDRAGLHVSAILLRAGTPVGGASAVTGPTGAWSARLRSAPHTAHAFGDDRDAILIVYGPGGPKPDEIATGSGGNPFLESGWTGWYDLDTGFRVQKRSVLIAPCGQVGVLHLTVDGAAQSSPVTGCGTETDASDAATHELGPGSRIVLSSEDNRAPSPVNPNGALITLTVALGEPGARAAAGNNQVLFEPSGLPTCTADLRAQSVRCGGLVPHASYRLIRTRGRRRGSERARASGAGVAVFAAMPGPLRVTGGDVMRLLNAAGRMLTALHVAHLRVAIDGSETTLAGGRCQGGDYWGPPVRTQPLSSAVNQGGVTGTGTICPNDGHAQGLPDSPIEQTDDFSGGLTRTEVPLLEGTDPGNDATVYGAFVALAQTGLPTANGGTYAGGTAVALTIAPAGSTHVAFHAANVDTSAGAAVGALPAGVYDARWVVRDVNGDTRTVQTTFVEAG